VAGRLPFVDALRMNASGAQGTAVRIDVAGQAALPLIALAAGVPLLLVLSRLLPSDGLGLGLRLAAGAACVLLLPGAFLTAAFGWPRHLSIAAAASFSWSLAALFVALGITFLVDGSLTLTLLLLVAITLAALVVAVVRGGEPLRRIEDGWPVLGVVVAGSVLGRLVLESPVLFRGDAPFHVARVVKLVELPALDSLGAVNEFADGDLHPGYAVPLWHGALALVARLSGVEPVPVFTYLPALLAPLAFVLAYAAGAALFRSWAGGVATVAAQAAILTLPRDGVGSLRLLTDPERASVLLLIPALLALLFAYVRDPRPALLAAISAAGFVNAVIHPTYVPFLAFALAGFLVARFILARDARATVFRVGVALGAMLVPAGLFVAALAPTLKGVSSINPSSDVRAHEVGHYAGFFGGEGDWLRPEAITREGGAVVAGLLVAPLAVFAARRLWAALVLGGTLAVLVVAVTPFLFGPLGDLVSLSQARRLPLFLPLPFALAGAAVLAGRLRLAGVAAALGAGIAFRLAFPREYAYQFLEGGPAWPVWVALAGSACALAVGALWRHRESRRLRAGWAVLAAAAFVVPSAVGGIANIHRARAGDHYKLTRGLVAALRQLEPRTVLFAHPETSYRAAGYAPVYIAAGSPGHVAKTVRNRPKDRVKETTSFFEPETNRVERRRLLAAYDADWLLVGPPRRAEVSPYDLPSGLSLVYSDDRYRLYHVP
jgi:hypothetical protein